MGKFHRGLKFQGYYTVHTFNHNKTLRRVHYDQTCNKFKTWGNLIISHQRIIIFHFNCNLRIVTIMANLILFAKIAFLNILLVKTKNTLLTRYQYIISTNIISVAMPYLLISN